MLRDIDYAAEAVKAAVVEKFGRANSLENLRVVAGETLISVQDGQRSAEGTRDNLLIALRKSGSYENFWTLLAAAKSPLSKATT